MSRLTERNYPNRRLTELRKNGLLKIDMSYSHVEAITNKLAHYEDLEEQGRLIELPCKPNEIVWVASDYIPTQRTMYVCASHIIHSVECGTGIGYTKEEAEAKLKEMKETEEEPKEE